MIEAQGKGRHIHVDKYFRSNSAPAPDVSSDARLHQRPQTGGQLRAEWVVLPEGVAGVELGQDVGAQPVPVAPAVDLYGRLQSGGCAGTEPIPDARGHFVNLVKEAALVDHTLLEKKGEHCIIHYSGICHEVEILNS